MRALTLPLLCQNDEDSIQRVRHVGEDIDIVHAVNREAFALQKDSSPFIIFHFKCIAMCRAIDFDNETMAHADEICDVWWNWHLSAKFITTQSAVTQITPESSLSFGFFATQGAGKSKCFG